MEDIKTYSIEDLEILLVNAGEPKFRAKQLYEWLHDKNCRSYDEMTNLPKSLRSYLSQKYPLNNSQLSGVQVSEDGSEKFLLSLSDGEKVETVGIISRQSDERERLTVCVSSQVGCPMACEFCATGKEGFTRNLTSTEIVDQVLTVQENFNMRVSNVVVMGQGEPFLNYDNLIEALHHINKDANLGIGARKITVSTSGIIDGIYRFIEEPEQFRLAISLHSAIQKKRDRLMPKLSTQPLIKLKEALMEYTEKRGRRTTLEYLMIKDVNDSEEDLNALIDFCNGINCHINLLPLNKIDDSSYSPSSSETMNIWIERLSANGISVSKRRSKGSDISGACGQLKNSSIN